MVRKRGQVNKLWSQSSQSCRRDGRMVGHEGTGRDVFVLRSLRKCASECEGFGDRICLAYESVNGFDMLRARYWKSRTSGTECASCYALFSSVRKPSSVQLDNDVRLLFPNELVPFVILSNYLSKPDYRNVSREEISRSWTVQSYGRNGRWWKREALTRLFSKLHVHCKRVPKAVLWAPRMRKCQEEISIT